ncbi:hypothetical protein A9Q83_09640 [Alphaproteobacteria bacterium 46_93_T64]|nr:hypothetical protein A9Q83_09640 [Alphaproteobacteria bacterium 46_93_T64]
MSRKRNHRAREVVISIETTGVRPDVDKIVSLSAIELLDREVTVSNFHTLVDPQILISAVATAVHGIDNIQVNGHPVITDVLDELMVFIGEDPIVSHYGWFDISFINAVLLSENRKPIPKHRLIDTLEMAKALFPDTPLSLEALLNRFDITDQPMPPNIRLHDALLMAKIYQCLSSEKLKIGLDD